MKDDVKDLVIARIDQLPPHIKLSIGDIGSLTKTEMIKSVVDETPVGEKLAEIQLSYIKSLIRK